MALLYGLCKLFYFPFLKIVILFSDRGYSELLLVLWYDFFGICGKWQENLTKITFEES